MLTSHLFLHRFCLWPKGLKRSLFCSEFLLWTFNQGKKVTAAITSDTHELFFLWDTLSVWVDLSSTNESPSQIIVNPQTYQMSVLKLGKKHVFIPAWASFRAKQYLWEKLAFSNTSPPENVSDSLFWNGYWNIFKACYQNVLSKKPQP